ncbi:MAG: hypothetical protein ACR2MC_10205 [Actinomycetota bacterium]
MASPARLTVDGIVGRERGSTFLDGDGRRPPTGGPRPVPAHVTAAAVVLATVLAACSISGAGGSSLTKEKTRGGRMAKRPRHELNPVTAARAGGCRNKETVFARVDDDELRDRVYHDWIRGGAVLGVCTGDGRTDQRPGAGMSEELQIVDVQEDGRDEILFGGNSCCAEYFDAAVFRKGKLRLVLRPKGEPLLLINGIVDDGFAKAFGCRRSAGEKTRKLVKASARRTSARRFRWTRASFRLEDASAKRTLIEKGRTRSRGGAYEVAAALVKAC